MAQTNELGTSTIIKILATVGDFNGFAIFSLDCFRTSIWDPPGLRLESISPPRWLKPVSKEPWGRPRADPNYFFGRQMQKWMLTWRVLERSRTLSGGQGAPRCLWAAIWDAFRLHFDLIWTLKPPPGVFSQAMLSRFSPRQGIESSILAGQQNCRSCKISASGMLSARWPASGAQPPVRSGHRALSSCAAV